MGDEEEAVGEEVGVEGWGRGGGGGREREEEEEREEGGGEHAVECGGAGGGEWRWVVWILLHY